MDRMSVNGKLIPQSSITIDEQYSGHFLKVSYIEMIAGHNIFSKDRVDVDADGSFRFFVPKKELLIDEMVTVEVFAPNGELLGKQIYSYGSLHASDIPVGADDSSQPLEIAVDPKVIVFGSSSPAEQETVKINGKVIDASGIRTASGLQIIIMVSDDPSLEPDSASFSPLVGAVTDKNGYFFTRIKNTSVQHAYGVIAGLTDTAIAITLEDHKIPKTLLLVTDLSDLPGEIPDLSDTVPGLPDSSDLVNSGVYSQDLGGKCVDFTVPNRTLEEFSFYHTVRTTEPEIRGLTITPKASVNIRNELLQLSNSVFPVFNRLNRSFSSLSLTPLTMTEDPPTDAVLAVSAKSAADAPLPQQNAYLKRYNIQVSIDKSTQLNINAHDFANENALAFSDLARLLAEQANRQKKLKELHNKLAAAYCGKNGVEDEKTFCESLTLADGLNRAEILSLSGHINKNVSALALDSATQKLLDNANNELKKLISSKAVDAQQVGQAAKGVEKLLQAIDKKTTESQEQENVLGYLRRILVELSDTSDLDRLNFEPCPPLVKSERMGIMCLMQKFEQIKDTLKNKSVLTLGEIVEIRAYYTIFLDSLSAFIALLDEYHAFYAAADRFSTRLLDDYFYKEYQSIKSALSGVQAQVARSLFKVEEIERAYLLNHPGRMNLSVETSVDWDETPTVYENTTIANGHILHFKQIYKANGYSLGKLLYSLPLAPCQEKQIAIFDWGRREEARRTEEQTVTEQLQADLSHNRTTSELVNSVFLESMRASSTNDTSSTSAGIGGGIGGFISPVVFGIAGGVSHSGASSTSTAAQDSSRNLAASSLSNLQDRVSQSASSLRSQRSTVVQTVGQNETVSVMTEVIKNHNHCHAMTVEYFEVLEHYSVEQRLVDVQECLFVPLPMGHFDNKKVLRWKNTLRKAVYGKTLQRGFDAIERIETNYINADFPLGSYAQENIEEFSGYFTLSFDLKRPYIKAIDEATKTEEYDLSIPFPWFIGKMVFHYDVEVPLTEAEKDAVFEQQYAPDIARQFIETLQVDAIAADGVERELALDFTLLSNYRKGAPLKVSIASKSLQEITREQIKHIRFRANTSVHSASRIILHSAFLNYRTPHINEYVVRNSAVNNDIINTTEVTVNLSTPPWIQVETKTDAALLYTPLNNRETRNPRKEDQEAAAALLAFLNEHLEMSHKVIWANMDASRLFGLLDGYIAPYSGGKSVASVVENKIMGIVGNNLVLKVIPGERLDPIFKGVEDLLGYYQPTTPPDPFRISVPTKGVYAEAVMGKCNSCEVIDETRHWRFTEVPCGDSPTAIQPISTDSRRTDPGNLQPKDFPASIINLQTAPSAPDPTGLAAAYELLGKGDAFRDITGLAGTQANALEALKTTSKGVTDLASISKDFANMAVMNSAKSDGTKQIEQIKKLNKEGYLSDTEANQKIKDVLDTYSNAAKSVNQNGGENSVTKQIAEKVVDQGLNSPNNEIEYTKTSPGGEVEIIKVTNPTATLEDATRAIIILDSSTASAETRAFNPKGKDKSLIIEVGASFKNAPAGSRLRWSSPKAGALIIDNPNANKTRVKGVIPGKQDLDVELLDAGGNVIASMKLKLSVPQCVTINEDAALFDAALTDIKLNGHKDEIVSEMKTVVEHLLEKANVRVYWQFGGLNEALPAHVPAINVVTAVMKNTNASGDAGVTTGPVGSDAFNETIELFAGAFHQPNAIDVDTETQALIIQLESSLPGDLSLIPTAVKVYGRLLGETFSHEIGHALLWDDIAGGHNNPAITYDLMNSGLVRMFLQRTGMENTKQVSPVKPEHYQDYGLGAIGGFQAVNQGLIDGQWPVPPAHG